MRTIVPSHRSQLPSVTRKSERNTEGGRRRREKKKREGERVGGKKREEGGVEFSVSESGKVRSSYKGGLNSRVINKSVKVIGTPFLFRGVRGGDLHSFCV